MTQEILYTDDDYSLVVYSFSLLETETAFSTFLVRLAKVVDEQNIDKPIIILVIAVSTKARKNELFLHADVSRRLIRRDQKFRRLKSAEGRPPEIRLGLLD